jgi:hypothetical protein
MAEEREVWSTMQVVLQNRAVFSTRYVPGRLPSFFPFCLREFMVLCESLGLFRGR